MNKKILLAVGLIVAGALVLQARSFSVANNLPAGEYFKIKPKGSHLCLALEKGRSYGKLVLGSCSRDGAKWKFRRVRNGVYKIENKRGGYLNVKDIRKSKSRATHAPSGRRVKLLAQTDDTFFIKLEVGGKVLDVRGNARKRGTHVIQYKYHGRSNQQWQLRFVNTGRTFNRVTYRPAAPERDRSHANSSGSHVDLNTSIQRGDYAVERYFKACTSSQLRADNEGDFLGSYFSSQKLTKRITVAMRVIKGTRQNSSSRVRSMVYKGLLGVDFAGGNFVEKLAKGALKKEINKAMRVERQSYSNKKYLNQLLQKMR